MLFIEEALFAEALDHLLKGQLKGADTGRLHRVDIKLVFTMRGINLDVTIDNDGLSIFRLEFDFGKAASPADAGQQGVLVLKSEIGVAASSDGPVGDLSGDGKARRQIVIEHLPD